MAQCLGWFEGEIETENIYERQSRVINCFLLTFHYISDKHLKSEKK